MPPRRPTAVAIGAAILALAASSPAANAQLNEQPYRSYRFSGCAEGVIDVNVLGNGQYTFIRGQIACFDGIGTLFVGTTPFAPSHPTVRIVGELDVTFNPAFAGTRIDTEGGRFPFTYVTANGSTGRSALELVLSPEWAVGQGGSAFRSQPAVLPADYRSADLELASGPIYLRYGLSPRYPFTLYADLPLTLTPIPEPATVALVALGFAGVGVIARRRKQ